MPRPFDVGGLPRNVEGVAQAEVEDLCGEVSHRAWLLLIHTAAPRTEDRGELTVAALGASYITIYMYIGEHIMYVCMYVCM